MTDATKKLSDYLGDCDGCAYNNTNGHPMCELCMRNTIFEDAYELSVSVPRSASDIASVFKDDK